MPADTDVHTTAHAVKSSDVNADTIITTQHTNDDNMPTIDEITSITYDR